MELAIEERAFECGVAVGEKKANEEMVNYYEQLLAAERRERDKGAALAVVRSGLSWHADAASIIKLLSEDYGMSHEAAAQFLQACLGEHPQDGAYLEGTLPWQTA